MPKHRITENPYPDLVVSDEQRGHLVDFVSGLVEGYFQDYEDFVVVDKHRVDRRRWKHVKSKDNLNVYSERPQKESTTSSFSSWNPGDGAACDKDLPAVLSVGTIAGQLNDFMFGAVNPTQDALHVKVSYVDDIDAASILCPVVKPTEEEPFRSLVIKWMTIDLPLQSTSLVKSRDFVSIEATGILNSANGERVGYYLLHSIEFPETKPRANMIRANHSAFIFFHQIDDNVIDVFGRGTVDPGGAIKRFLMIHVAAEAMLAVAKYIYCGHMKKLSWVLRRQYAVVKQQTQLHSGNCVTCEKKVSSGIRGIVGSSTCKLCYGCVCNLCKVRKLISFVSVDGQLQQRKISFCAMCLSKASKVDAKKAAIDEALGSTADSSSFILSESDTLETSSDEM